MSRPVPAPRPTPADIQHQHDRDLQHALHNARPVLYQGKWRFIQFLGIGLYGGGTQTTLYLTGSPDEVPADQVQTQGDL